MFWMLLSMEGISLSGALVEEIIGARQVLVHNFVRNMIPSWAVVVYLAVNFDAEEVFYSMCGGDVLG